MAFDIQNLASNTGVILACHITGFHDVNRNTTLEDNNYELVREWAESVAAAGLKGIIFHNNFSEQTCERFQNESIAFMRVEHDPRFNPNVFRYLVYNEFLQRHIQHFKSIFITDICDVVVVQNPFIHPHFIANPDALFCGDEPKTLENDWMKAHSTRLRSEIADFADYEEKYKNSTLLNCGIIDYVRRYDIVKRLETQVKAVTALATNVEPTVVEPGRYAERLLEAADRYLAGAPTRWR
jgi:hypothetical protein